jgi:hypothetical protein
LLARQRGSFGGTRRSLWRLRRARFRFRLVLSRGSRLSEYFRFHCYLRKVIEHSRSLTVLPKARGVPRRERAHYARQRRRQTVSTSAFPKAGLPPTPDYCASFNALRLGYPIGPRNSGGPTL